MSERKELTRSDWLGIALFAIGSLGAVVMLFAMSANGPVEEQGRLGPYAAAWKGMLGIYPSLFLNAAIAFLGARLFLGSGLATLRRNLIGCAGLALAIAVVCGSWKDDAGGWVGLHTGAVVSQHLHVVLGTLLGLLAFAAVAWFAWFRLSAFVLDEPATEVPVTAVLGKPATKIAPRPAVHKTTAANEGVSAAESAALFPEDDEPVVVKPLTADEVARAALAPFSAAEIPPSPYPEDVRRKGQIPAGARPLENPHASAETAQGAVSSPSVYRWTAPPHEHAADGAGAHLAETPARRELDLDEAVEREETPDLSAARLPASPSWEQPVIPFQPEAGDEEPVDAYGTPLTLVEKLRKARREAGFGEQSPASALEPTEVEAAAVPRELDADLTVAEADDEPTATIGEETTLEVLEFEAVEVTIEESDEDDGDEEDEIQALEDDPIDEDEDESLELEEDEADLEDTVVSEVEEQDDLDLEDEPEPDGAPIAPARAPRVAAEHQQGLFDAVLEPAVAAQPAERASERDVVLQPVASASVERRTKDPHVETDTRAKLLREIGCLFIERGRVAVSMLQRQYEMDFDEACKVLDDLQEMGLIGPYLGGQRRDILLDRAQWLEVVAKAGAAR